MLRSLTTVAVAALLVSLSACGGSDGDGVDDGELSSSAVEETSSTESSTTTSSSTTTRSTTEATAEDPDGGEVNDDELVDQLMATLTTFGRLYGRCAADPAACDVTTLDPYLGQPLKGQIEAAVAEWAAQGRQLRGFADEEYTYVQHEQALSQPPTYGLEVCVSAGPQTVYEVAADGSETLIQDSGGPVSRVLQVLMEQRPDGEFVINVSQAGDETAEGTTCESSLDE